MHINVFDLVPDTAAALETAITLGFERILTSGGEERAIAGLNRLKTIVAQCAGRIAIMPGSGVNADNVATLLAALPVRDIHASCGRQIDFDANSRATALGFTSAEQNITDAESIAQLKEQIMACCRYR